MSNARLFVWLPNSRMPFRPPEDSQTHCNRVLLNHRARPCEAATPCRSNSILRENLSQRDRKLTIKYRNGDAAHDLPPTWTLPFCGPPAREPPLACRREGGKLALTNLERAGPVTLSALVGETCVRTDRFQTDGAREIYRFTVPPISDPIRPGLTHR